MGVKKIELDGWTLDWDEKKPIGRQWTAWRDGQRIFSANGQALCAQIQAIRWVKENRHLLRARPSIERAA